ncbi:hypothetical protein QWY90_14840 [Flavobacterium paronense]|uniref:Uncharacterized protein n=1 Tax=Flavobacterium paronense TaxID=1392775 RepID=A0ABV5GF84_9FLAO|nr:hypothetical protein [Flavobacterium paronense]MDN3678590.1 hypothetical protein [Flavobacterium paronense]
MRKQDVIRIYKHSDGTLVTKGLEKVAYMQRDKTEFGEYGITSNLVNDLKTLITEFSERLTDVEALGDQTGVTENKDAKAEEIRTVIRGIMGRVVLVYPFGSPKYKKFGTEELARQTDADLLITAKRVVRVGNEFMGELTANGLTPAILDSLTALTEEFTTLIVDMKMEIGRRDIEQEDRVEAGNAIYTTLVKYTNTGQTIWETTDLAKFNDYVLYNTISGEDETPPPPATPEL